jgi:hypothetical protein
VRKYLKNEIKKLIRERKALDTAIAYFERLEAQSPVGGEPSGPTATAQSEMKRKPRPRFLSGGSDYCRRRRKFD